jgi:hypothetical protein
MLLCFVALSIFFAFLNLIKPSRNDSNFDPDESHYVTNNKLSSNFSVDHKMGLNISLPIDQNLIMDKEIDTLFNQINPYNDWLISVNFESENNFIQNPSNYGIRIIDILPELGIVRFSVFQNRQALPFINEMLVHDKLGVNIPLRQPLPPRTDFKIEGEPFNNSFIEWLGGSKSRAGLGRGVRVAVIDSGIDISHPVLQGVSIQERYSVPELDSVPEGSLNPHGTAIASIIASSTTSYSGVAPGSEILSYRVIDDSGETNSFAVASAIVSAVEDGAHLINLSLGGRESSEVLEKAVSYSLGKGVSIVAAVGNDGVGLVNYPAAYDGVIGVTSVSTNGRVSDFANYGEGVDFAAPGTGVLTAWESFEMARFSGTSISSAIVTGALAMELSRRPNLTPLELEKILINYSNETEELGHDLVSGYGVVSLSRLENQGNLSYTDPAIVGYNFEYLNGLNSGTVPFEVMVQNQGNTWLNNLTLQVDYLDISRSTKIDNLGPGKVRVETLYLQGHQIEGEIEINSRLKLSGNIQDNRPENNQRNSLIELR